MVFICSGFHTPSWMHSSAIVIIFKLWIKYFLFKNKNLQGNKYLIPIKKNWPIWALPLNKSNSLISVMFTDLQTIATWANPPMVYYISIFNNVLTIVTSASSKIKQKVVIIIITWYQLWCLYWVLESTWDTTKKNIQAKFL